MYYTVGLIVLALASVGVWLGNEFLSNIFPKQLVWSICFILAVWGFSSLLRAVIEDAIRNTTADQLNSLKSALLDSFLKEELSKIKESLAEIKEILKLKTNKEKP